jgi:antitoxin ParD1/3/4
MAIFGYARVSTDDAECLSAVRARIRRSLDDPRPDMTLEEVDAHLAAAFTRAEQADRSTPE